ncbi:MAG TPA: cytochrome b [Albitalea sp.]
MPDDRARYDKVAIALHWVIGIALLAQIAFGFMLDDIAPRGTPARSMVINLHKSIGLVLGIAIVARLAWRLAHRPPAWPATMPSWQQRAALWTHRALYTCMVLMPVSGYVASNFSKHGVKFFNVVKLEPWGPDLKAVYDVFNGIHVTTAVVFTALIALHVGAALRHAWLRRDGVFRRMWPRAGAARGGRDGGERAALTRAA